MVTWYMARYSGAYSSMKPVEVERATDACVWFNGRRHNKTSDYESYFSTWEQAHQHLIARAEQDVDIARRRLEVANSALGNIKGMTP